MKPGIKTTEFWLSLAPLVVGALLLILGHTEAGNLLLGGGAAQGANYARGRVELKRNGGT